MKKIILSGLCLTLASCTLLPTTASQENLTGEWLCKTEYRDLGVGTIDLITLNQDGTIYDENYIFDNGIKRIIDEPIQDYFQSPFKYLTFSKGTWKLAADQLTYTMTKQSAKRIIYPDVWTKLKANKDTISDFEKRAFKIYSSGINKEDNINLKMVKFSPNKFTVIQAFDTTSNESICVKKSEADKELLFKLSAYKQLENK